MGFHTPDRPYSRTSENNLFVQEINSVSHVDDHIYSRPETNVSEAAHGRLNIGRIGIGVGDAVTGLSDVHGAGGIENGDAGRRSCAGNNCMEWSGTVTSGVEGTAMNGKGGENNSGEFKVYSSETIRKEASRVKLNNHMLDSPSQDV